MFITRFAQYATKATNTSKPSNLNKRQLYTLGGNVAALGVIFAWAGHDPVTDEDLKAAMEADRQRHHVKIISRFFK